MHARPVLLLSLTLLASSAPAQAKPAAAFPLQLELRVPFDPTAFPSGPHLYAMYELHLTNFFPFPLALRRIEVLNPDAVTAPPVATFEADQLISMVQLIGSKPSSDPTEKLTLAGGQTAIVFMSVTFDRNAHVPDHLLHRVITAQGAVEGATISTHHTELHVLGPPVGGADWMADDGPSNDEDNHHRRGVIILAGQAVDSRRYAIDWKQVHDGASFSGNAKDVHAYSAYGKPVLAVSDARVVAARDGLPDNVPGHGDAFHPAVPITLETITGNTITLDLGGGQFAYYLHLEPGSLRVKAGDRVRSGQVIAAIGATGDAREPHLHFEVTTSATPLAGEGVPYLIDHYRTANASHDATELHTREMPLDKTVVAFDEAHSQ